MKVNLKKVKKMEKGLYIIKMVRLDIKEISRMVNLKDMEYMLLKMENIICVNLKKA